MDSAPEPLIDAAAAAGVQQGAPPPPRLLREGEPLKLVVLGVNHLTGSVGLRDRLLFSEADRAAFGQGLISAGGAAEAVVLSTCNRSEIYAMVPDTAAGRPFLEKAWGEARGVSREELRSHGYFHADGEGLRHLFRVAGSLDSLVLGEMQVFGQVKDAYQDAVERGTAGFHLNRIFQAALHTGKRIHHETSIHEGAVSISYAAVELAKKVLSDLEGKTVGVVGAGEMGELAAQHLQKAGVGRFLFFNRSLGAAEKLAAHFGGEVAALDDLPLRLSQCDIVISATGAPGYVIGRREVQEAMRRRGGHPLFLIDIAAPRDIEPAAGDIGNVFLFGIDDLKQVVAENLAQRKEASLKALEIVEEEAGKVEAWLEGLHIVPVIRSLRGKYEEMMRRELERFGSSLTAEERRRLEAFARGLMNKFLHVPTQGLKTLGERGEGREASHYADLIFSLSDRFFEKGDGHAEESR